VKSKIGLTGWLALPTEVAMDQGRGKPQDGESPPARGGKAEREARLAQALRDNLRRRKAAARPHGQEPSED
jgi:hypothetical protein